MGTIEIMAMITMGFAGYYFSFHFEFIISNDPERFGNNRKRIEEGRGRTSVSLCRQTS